MEHRKDTVDRIREFNRFYTNILGLLDKHILDSRFTFAQARLLYELSQCGECRANALSEALKIDKSYLSRLLAGFEKEGLIQRQAAPGDNRGSLVRLTQRGAAEAHTLIKTSNAQIGRLLAPLSDEECGQIRAAMDTIQCHIARASAAPAIRSFTGADVEQVIARQVALYEQEYGLTTDIWKTYVADGVHKLVAQFDPQKDCLYILEQEGGVAGSIAITHTGEGTGQLRFFFVDAALRGQGAGRRLMDLAVDFCREKGYRRVFLWTFSKLAAARHLYARAGFTLQETHENADWGAPVIEERWELAL